MLMFTVETLIYVADSWFFFFNLLYLQYSSVSVACENSFCVSFLYGITHTNLCNEQITVRVYNVDSSAGYLRTVDTGTLGY